MNESSAMFKVKEQYLRTSAWPSRRTRAPTAKVSYNATAAPYPCEFWDQRRRGAGAASDRRDVALWLRGGGALETFRSTEVC